MSKGNGSERTPGVCRGPSRRGRRCRGQADDDAGEDEQRHAVADAALGDLLTQPHDEGGAGSEREHAERNEEALARW